MAVLYNIAVTAVNVYSALVFIYCLFSWIPGSRGVGTLNQIYTLLGKIVNPYLNIFRKFIPPIGGTIDISPIIALLVLQVIVNLFFKFIFSLFIM